MKTIGLIGGLGWRSTAFYYAAIQGRGTEMNGEGAGVPLVLWSMRHRDLHTAVAAGDTATATRMLVSAGERLVAAGAECVAIACNSAHLFAEPLAAALSVEFIDIRDAVGRAVARSGARRVGLLATSFTVGGGLYRRLLEKGYADEIIIPPAETQAWMDDVIFNRLCGGVVRDLDGPTLARAAEALAAAGAEAVILGCTDLNLLRMPRVDVPVIDSAEAHAQELAAWSAAA